MPDEIAARSRLTGVELDPSPPASPAALPDADISAQGFEKTALVDGSFDLAISTSHSAITKLSIPSSMNATSSFTTIFFAKPSGKCAGAS